MRGGHRYLQGDGGRSRQREAESGYRKGRFSTSGGAYKHLELSLLQWSALTPSGRVDHIGKVDPSWKKAGAISLGAETKDQSTDDTLGSFEDTGLPVFLHGSWKNANKIVNMQGIGPYPNDKNKMTMISLSCRD